MKVDRYKDNCEYETKKLQTKATSQQALYKYLTL